MMSREDMLLKMQDLFRDVLDNEEMILTEDISAKDIEEWDSLTNIQLIVAIEKSFGIRFTSSEIISWKNIGEMLSCIENK